MKAINLYRQDGIYRWAWLCLFFGLSFSFVMAQTSSVVIAEIMYDNPLQDNEAVRPGVNGEFLSVYNYGEDDVNVGGWRVEITDATSLSKYTYTIPANTVLPSMSLAIIASRASSTFDIWSFYGITKPDSSRDVVLYTSTLAFPDTRSKVAIYNAKQALEDEVTYDGNSSALQGQTLLRAQNGIKSASPKSKILSIQRRNIVINEDKRVISRDDFSADTIQLFSYMPTGFSYTASPISSAPGSETLSLSGTVTGSSYKRACKIESSQIISVGRTTYLAEEEIVLKPGFEVKPGAELDATLNRESFHHVTMLTYNLGTKANGYDKHAEIVKDSKADVVSVQEVRREVNFNTLKEKSGLSGMMCVTIYYIPKWLEWARWLFEPIAIRYGIGMLWNVNSIGAPIAHSTQVLDLPNDMDKKRAFIVAEFQDFCFVATHYSLDAAYRLDMSNAILANWLVRKCLNSRKPVYIAGDLNAEAKDPNAASLNRLKGEGFKILNNINDTTHSTFPQEDINKGYIDLILEHNTNPYHKIIERGIPARNTTSDHYPYSVKVKIK